MRAAEETRPMCLRNRRCYGVSIGRGHILDAELQ